MSFWDNLVEVAVLRMDYEKVLCSALTPTHYQINGKIYKDNEIELFNGLSKHDRASVEVDLLDSTFQVCVRGDNFRAFPTANVNSSHRNLLDATDGEPEKVKKLVLFSTNDYLALGSHPSVTKAAATAVLEHGMGPRAGTLMCGYTSYHQQLELVLADLKHKEIKLFHEEKFVITDSMISMEGDYVSMPELVRLRKKHGFLLVLDEAHATLVFGKNGGGLADEFDCEDEVDISIGTLSKAAGSVGGFIACSKRWRQLIQSKGRAFMFSAALPIPVVAATLASVTISRNEKWRRIVLWKLIKEFKSLSGIPITSPIVSIVVGTEEKAIQASGYLLQCGFHTTAVIPPVVNKNSCRLRLTLNVSHTTDDLKRVVKALSDCHAIEVPYYNNQAMVPRSRI